MDQDNLVVIDSKKIKKDSSLNRLFYFIDDSRGDLKQKID